MSDAFMAGNVAFLIGMILAVITGRWVYRLLNLVDCNN